MTSRGSYPKIASASQDFGTLRVGAPMSLFIDRLGPGFILPRWTDTGATYSGGKVVLPLRYSLD